MILRKQKHSIAFSCKNQLTNWPTNQVTLLDIRLSYLKTSLGIITQTHSVPIINSRNCVIILLLHYIIRTTIRDTDTRLLEGTRGTASS